MMRTRPLWQISLAVLLALVVTPLALGVGSGGTGLRVYARAALSVAGGIVVNGITFDPSQAVITINGRNGRTAGELRPGMVAGVDGNVIPGSNYGVARSIEVSRVALGVVASVGSGGTGLKVAGIYVTPRTDVVMEGCATVSDIVPGTTVDVYGYSDGITGVVNATRIECVAPSYTVRLHGVALAIAPGSIVVNGVLVDVTNAQFVGFDGSIVAGDRVAVDGTASSQGIMAATVTFDPDAILWNGEGTEVEDAISAMISPSVFVIDALEVDATNAKFSGGTMANLAVGRVAHVQGTVVNGILNAKSVEFDDDESDNGTHYATTSEADDEMDDVDGTIASIASTTTFVVNNVTVDAGAAIFVNGAATGIAVGKKVKVVGRRTGARMKAVRVTFSKNGSMRTPVRGKDPRVAIGANAVVNGAVGEVTASGIFIVGGIKVNLRAAKFSGGNLPDIAKGTHIHATGAFLAGVLIATQVEIANK